MTWWPSTRRTHIVNKQFTNVALISSLCAPPHTIRTILTIHHRLCIQLVSKCFFYLVIHLRIHTIDLLSFMMILCQDVTSLITFLFFLFFSSFHENFSLIDVVVQWINTPLWMSTIPWCVVHVDFPQISRQVDYPSKLSMTLLNVMKYIIALLIHQPKKPTVPGSDSISRRNTSWTWNSFANLNV